MPRSSLRGTDCCAASAAVARRPHHRCSYSVPHPLQAVMHIHVQTLPKSGHTCSDAMLSALKQTGTLCDIMCARRCIFLLSHSPAHSCQIQKVRRRCLSKFMMWLSQKSFDRMGTFCECGVYYLGPAQNMHLCFHTLQCRSKWQHSAHFCC